MKYLRKVTSAAEIVDPKLDKPSVFFDFTNKVIKCFKKYAEPTKYKLYVYFIDKDNTEVMHEEHSYDVAAGDLQIEVQTVDAYTYTDVKYFSPDEVTPYDKCSYEAHGSDCTFKGTMPAANLYIKAYVTLPSNTSNN